MQPETATDNRKTFRLNAAAAVSLATLRRNHSTENEAINHALVELPKKIEQQQKEIIDRGVKLTAALEEGRQWKEKQQATQRELDQLKNALALVGKLLNPSE